MKLTNSIIASVILISLNACVTPPVKTPDTRPTQSATQKITAFNWNIIGLQDGSKVLNGNIANVSLKKYHLAFQEKKFSLKGGCNLIGGHTQITNSTIKFSSIFSSRRACQSALMKADSGLISILKAVTTYRLEANNTLILSGFNAGQSLLLRGKPTHETKYSGKGIRKFIQIKNTAQGIVWREAKYNSQSIQTNKNARWNTTAFPGIEGFVPQKNQEYTVRIKEFDDSQSGKKVWIKDLIVMQGVLN